MSKPGLPSNWSVVPLRRIVAPTRPRILPSELPELPYVGMEHVEAHSMRLLGTVPAGSMKSSGVRFHRGDILYGRLRPYLNKVWLANVEGLCSAEFIVLPPSEALESRYLSYLLNSADFVSFAAHLNEGDRPRVDFDQLAQFPVPVPPRLEQARIAEEIEKQFTRLDAGVAALKRVQAQLKRYRASVLKAACEGRLVPTEAELARREKRDYEPADKLLARILKDRRARWEADQLVKMKAAGKPPKDDKWKAKYVEPSSAKTAELASLPEGWVWASLDALSTRITDGVHKKPNYVDDGVPFVTVKNLTAGSGIDLEHLNYVSEADHAEFTKRTRPELGDLLISKDGTLGVVRLVRTTRAFSIFVSVALMKPVLRNVGPYLEFALSSPQVQRQMVPKGTGLVHLHLEDLREDCVPLPPLNEQRRIVDAIAARLSVAEAAEASIELGRARASRLRQGVLRRAFEGTLVAQDPNDEPASKLLERISAAAENNPLPKQGRAKQTTTIPKMKATR